MKKGRPEIYNRISQRQKLRFLFLVSHDKMSVKKVIFISTKASYEANINYSTAKTILFLYRK